MNERRLISICLLYCGVVLVAQSAVASWLGLGVATTLFHFFNGLIFLVMGSNRWRTLDGNEQSKGKYSLSTHTIAILSAFLTLIFVGELLILY